MIFDANNHEVLSPIIAAVEQALKSKKRDMGWQKPLILAIDGYCGSGKTYYSKLISEHFGASIVHCDDFFLPKQMRTPERLGEMGGNVHYERLAEVLGRVRQGKSFTYQAYDCSTDSFVDRYFEATDVVVVEGSYALRSNLRQYYDVEILLTVDKVTQYNRLLQREGKEGIINFVNKWIPLENNYFDQLDTSQFLIIDTTHNN